MTEIIVALISLAAAATAAAFSQKTIKRLMRKRLEPHRIGLSTVYIDKSGLLYCPICYDDRDITILLQGVPRSTYKTAFIPARWHCKSCDFTADILDD